MGKATVIITYTVMDCRLAASIQEREFGLALKSTMKTLAQGSLGMSQKVQRILAMIREGTEDIAGNVINHCSDCLKAMNRFGSPEV